MSRRNWDHSEWHEGMTLPSRKETHRRTKLKQKPAKLSKAQDRVALQEMQQARAEATATSVVEGASWREEFASGEMGSLSDEERDLLWGSASSNGERSSVVMEEVPPFFSVRQRVLLWIGTVCILLFIFAWGKLAYVHHIPDLVRHQVPAYQHNAAYLVLKPWWFGPPVLDFTSYTRDSAHLDWEIYKARLGDYASIVESPHVLWSFSTDLLQ